MMRHTCATKRQVCPAGAVLCRCAPGCRAGCAAGYHLGDVNTALDPLAADLGLAVATQARPPRSCMSSAVMGLPAAVQVRCSFFCLGLGGLSLAVAIQA